MSLPETKAPLDEQSHPPSLAMPHTKGVPTRLSLSRYSGLFVWALIIGAFALWVPHTFLTTTTLTTVAGEEAITAVLAMSLIAPLAAGVFDLSVAAILGFAILMVMWLQEHHVNAVLAVLLTLVVGAAIGSANGFLVVVLRIDSFIATLGVSSVLAGASYWISGGNQLTGGLSRTFVTLGQAEPIHVPVLDLYMLGVAVVLFYIYEFTTVGRYLYATGGNLEASRLAGVRVSRMIFGSLVSSGLMAAFAGVMLAASLGAATYDLGPSYLLPAFSAVFLGSTQIKAGRVNVIGTLIAVYLLATGIKGLQLAGAPSYISDIFDGVALILAVGLSVRGRNRN